MAESALLNERVGNTSGVQHSDGGRGGVGVGGGAVRTQRAANWFKKMHSSCLYRGREPFSRAAQIASGAEMKCLRKVQVQASVRAGPVNGLFIKCHTVRGVTVR